MCVRLLVTGATVLALFAAGSRSPSEAEAVIDGVLRGIVEMAPEAKAPARSRETEGVPLFVADVRLVSLAVSVTDARGLPFPGLRPEQFEVLENGVRQQIATAGAEEVPFNLVLLVDLSGSTIRKREAMRETARRFIGVARAQDHVALYAIADGQFRILSPLTTDHRRLLTLAGEIPDLAGGTPLYASVALAWDEELARHPSERNAIITISDGIDDSLEGKPGHVPFSRLRRAVRAMPTLLYPVHLDSRNLHYGERALRQMRELASATGGRIFVSGSLQDLEPVYAQVAEELRSVYSLAYYPKDQSFNGRWRRIEVRVRQPGLRLRTRAGYYAR
jgi:VWFA-related protein